MLAGRTADTLAGWLRAHPGDEIVCRDSAGAYAEGATTRVPDALLVAGRWHIWHNLGDAVERAVARYRDCLRAPEDLEPVIVHQQQSLVRSEVFEQSASRTGKWLSGPVNAMPRSTHCSATA